MRWFLTSQEGGGVTKRRGKKCKFVLKYISVMWPKKI